MQDDVARDNYEKYIGCIAEPIDRRTELQHAVERLKYNADALKRATIERDKSVAIVAETIEKEIPAIKKRFKEWHGEEPEGGDLWNGFLHASLLTLGMPDWYELDTDFLEE